MIRGKRGRRLTEEEDKGDAVQDQDVRYVGNASVAKELHLLFCGAHEQETRGIEKLSTVSMLFITRDINGNSRMEEDIGSCEDPIHRH